MSYGLDSLTDFDRKLAALCQSVKTVVVPGPNDPTNSSWPQRSFKKGLFPKSSSCGDTHFLENPSWAVIDECKFLFSAGQNLDDMRRYDVTNDMLELAELCLRCRHIAPSAPDTLCISLQSH